MGPCSHIELRVWRCRTNRRTHHSDMLRISGTYRNTWTDGFGCRHTMLAEYRHCQHLKMWNPSKRRRSLYFLIILIVVGYPTPSKEWGHGGRPWSPRSRATSQGLDQKLYRDRESPKSERCKESVAGQCRRRCGVSWDECPQALQEGFLILPILER